MPLSTEHELGRLAAKVESLEKEVTEQGTMLREVRDAVVSAKGSWKLLLAVAGLAATLGAVLSQIISWLTPGTGQ